jgi:CO/xanthine dehydrogenase FAD-binding subunit
VKPVAFDYLAARSLDEALAALADDEDAKPIAGGQSLVPALTMRLVRPTLLVDLNRAGLDEVAVAEGGLRIGATARQAAIERDPRAHPLLREALGFVGHTVTRNRGTVGGSVAHADGAAEIPVCLTALRGSVLVSGPEGTRSVAPDAFFVTHYTTTLAHGELVVGTTWPDPLAGEGCAFEELALRAGDYALSMAAVVLRRDGGVARDVRVVVGAVSDRPLALVDAAAALEGTAVTDADVAAAGAAATAAVEPHGTLHATADYLRAMTGVVVARAARRAWEAAV